MNDDILKIGRVVEVSGSKVIGELEGTVGDLYRTYKSRRYTVGQVGSTRLLHKLLCIGARNAPV